MHTSLLSKLKVNVEQNIRERLLRIDTEDYEKVGKKVIEVRGRQGLPITPNYIERGVLALKQYYAIALLDPANGHAVSAEVDTFWHAHMLFSKKYSIFCNDVVGEFMHHVPLDRDNQDQIENVRILYSYTMKVLPVVFDDLDSQMWPQNPTDSHLICWHFGNTRAYSDVQKYRLFEPSKEGVGWAFEELGAA